MLLYRVSVVSVQHFHWSVFDILPSPTSLEVQFSPGQLHRFKYQTPIQSSSLGLFEHHHAVRGRWAAEANGSWKYWVKILMEWSQSPSQPQPKRCALTCCLDTCQATFLLMCSCFRPKADKVNVEHIVSHADHRTDLSGRPRFIGCVTVTATLQAGNYCFYKVSDDHSNKEEHLFLLLHSHIIWNTNGYYNYCSMYSLIAFGIMNKVTSSYTLEVNSCGNMLIRLA